MGAPEDSLASVSHSLSLASIGGGPALIACCRIECSWGTTGVAAIPSSEAKVTDKRRMEMSTKMREQAPDKGTGKYRDVVSQRRQSHSK